jgi:NAD dependent epimerase/dehydratase family enzyme
MVKNILVVGASGLVGSNILELLEDGDSKITLLTRRKLEDKLILSKSFQNLITLLSLMK